VLVFLAVVGGLERDGQERIPVSFPVIFVIQERVNPLNSNKGKNERKK